MVEQEPKTRAGRRTLSVPESIMNTLAEHLAHGVDRTIPKLTFVFSDGTPLPTPTGGGVSGYRPGTGRTGDLTFHDVKHTAATLLVEEGIDVKTAQVRLGHDQP